MLPRRSSFRSGSTTEVSSNESSPKCRKCPPKRENYYWVRWKGRQKAKSEVGVHIAPEMCGTSVYPAGRWDLKATTYFLRSPIASTKGIRLETSLKRTRSETVRYPWTTLRSLRRELRCLRFHQMARQTAREQSLRRPIAN